MPIFSLPLQTSLKCNSPQYLTASSIVLGIRKVSGPEASSATRAFRERKAVDLTEGAKAVQARSADRRRPSERSKDSRGVQKRSRPAARVPRLRSGWRADVGPGHDGTGADAPPPVSISLI